MNNSRESLTEGEMQQICGISYENSNTEISVWGS